MVFFVSASASGKFRIDHHSKHFETTMQWCSLKFNRALLNKCMPLNKTYVKLTSCPISNKKGRTFVFYGKFSHRTDERLFLPEVC